jgi:hypothetical protein
MRKIQFLKTAVGAATCDWTREAPGLRFRSTMASVFLRGARLGQRRVPEVWVAPYQFLQIACALKPMKHGDAPGAPDRGVAIKRHAIAMPHGVPTSVKGPARVRTVCDMHTRTLNTKQAFGRCWRSTGPPSGPE